MNWGLVGCGVIGERRAMALPDGVKLTACFDPNPKRAQIISEKTEAKILNSADEVLKSGVQAVIIAAINSALVPLIQSALDLGIHVLVEKPAARNFQELASLKNPKNCKIKIGFNHRFHPAYSDLLKLLKANQDDPVMFIRAQYGNGARLGFDTEWRSQVDLAGGGELLDQGVHVLDLASVILPELQVVNAYTKTHFWKMPVDDNAWATLSSNTGATFTFHVSSTEWKNEFRFEVYTRKTKYQWLGLGRSYGPEKLIIHRMTPEMGPPKTEELSYSPEDNSWKDENTNFLKAILGEADIFGGHKDAVHTLQLVEQIYVKSLEAHKRSGLNLNTHPKWYGGPA